MKPILKTQNDKKVRTRFHPTDSEKLEADIWCELMKIEPTNPPEWEDKLKWGAGKGVELTMIDTLKFNGIIAEDYNQENLESTVMQREGVDISMKFDARTIKSLLKCEGTLLPQSEEIQIEDGDILEIKSINNKNFFDIQRYIDGYPKSNYVMQLSMYMDALGKDRGFLFVASIDGLNTFWFECKKREDGKYQCGNTIVDIQAEYKRFAEINRKFLAGEQPNWFEEIYKKPIEEIDWTQISDGDISKARNNQKVIGSEGKWKIDYSPFKNLIVGKQGITIKGYTDEEIAIIKEKTKGYTTWKK